MAKKLLVTLREPGDATTVRNAGCDIVAEYPQSLLVRATDAQRQTLQQARLEISDVAAPPIQLGGASFDFASARAANTAVPVAAPDPHRTAYYLVQLVGPAKAEWLDTIRTLGGTVQGNLPSFALLVGIPPASLASLESQSWVEGVTPFRPAMKVSPALRRQRSPSFGPAELATLDLPTDSTLRQVEISVFPGESTADVATRVRAADGRVLGQTPRSVVALASPTTIAALAAQEGVHAILPHGFAKLHNNRATDVMGVPAGGNFGGTVLRGAGQTIAIADSGLDTGDPATVHEDVRGRITALVSFAAGASLAPFTNDPPGVDDGTDDRFSAHGTHVAGSVAGNGAVASAAGIAFQPCGTAPEATIYFQAVEQDLHWKSRGEMIASGHPDPGPTWPPAQSGLYGLPDDLLQLFTPAYAAGARVHTNSWGSSDPQTFMQYNDNAQAVDAFMFNHRDMLILFAAGNDGVDDDGDGKIDPGSVSPPGTAKNCVTVGASENKRPHGSSPTPGLDKDWTGLQRWSGLTPDPGHVSDEPDGMAAFSSRGPTAENRIKPDVVAPGTNILSVRSSHYAGAKPPLWGDLAAGDPLQGKYCWSGGTSMSTPLVAGAAAVVRQYLIQERQHFVAGGKPSGALVKAMLVNGAARMEGNFNGEIPAGPNVVNGFGRVDLATTLASGAQAMLFDDEPDHAVGTGEMRVYEVTPRDGTRAIGVTLVWTDAPSLPGNGSLENKLYLQVRTPTGTVLDADLTPFPTPTNNVQRLVLHAPTSGTYQIRVRGIEVIVNSPGATPGPGGPRQDYALVVSNAQTMTLTP